MFKIGFAKSLRTSAEGLDGSENIYICYLFILVLTSFITFAITLSRDYSYKTLFFYMLLSITITIIILSRIHKKVMAFYVDEVD